MVSEITVEPTLFFYYLSVYLLFGGFQVMMIFPEENYEQTLQQFLKYFLEYDIF